MSANIKCFIKINTCYHRKLSISIYNTCLYKTDEHSLWNSNILSICLYCKITNYQKRGRHNLQFFDPLRVYTCCRREIGNAICSLFAWKDSIVVKKFNSYETWYFCWLTNTNKHLNVYKMLPHVCQQRNVPTA